MSLGSFKPQPNGFLNRQRPISNFWTHWAGQHRVNVFFFLSNGVNVLDDSELAEAIALHMGLQFAYDMGFLKLCAESDAINVVAALNSSSSTNPSYAGMICFGL